MKYKSLIMATILLGLFILCACQTESPVQTVEVTRLVPETIIVTEIVPQTVVATELVTQIVVITATPEPPTATPESTPTPDYYKFESVQVLDAFLSAGLEAEPNHPMTKDDIGLAPNVFVEGTRFVIPSICPDCGGRIMSFDDPTRLDVMFTYYDEIGKSSPIFFSWLFIHENILVQINGGLPQATAMKYKEALESLK